ncbi:tetratricopeptide repeat protein [Candidatus Parabeggiatoa sp. HSG14]|uniref:tetratricopeptide repeat protein n=1 Tax=Candidatus Parabeggiatoa sp. HSG14 TaxID=3055593 RepID=UPI0025A79B24|nr:tetratricopeptide repeat protein [Thiotrichales bacterium HSG14]
MGYEKYKPLNKVQAKLERFEPIAENLYQASLGIYRNGQIEQAFLIARQAVENNPNHLPANQLLAEILIKKKQFNEARKQLEQLYKSWPSEARLQLIQVLLILAQNSNNENEQLQLYDRILELERDHPHPEAKKGRKEIWQKRGNHAYEHGDLETALEAYKKAEIHDKVVEIETKIRTQILFPKWYLQAQTALQEGNTKKAQTLFAKIIAINPKYEEVSRYLHVAVTNVDSKELTNSNQSLAEYKQKLEESNQKLKKSNQKWLFMFTIMIIFSVVITNILFLRETRIIPLETQQLEKRGRFQKELLITKQHIEKLDRIIVKQLQSDKKQFSEKYPKFQSFLHVVVVEIYNESQKQAALQKVENISAYSNIGAGMFSTSDKKWLVNVGGFFYSFADANIFKKKIKQREKNAYIHTIDMNIIDNIIQKPNNIAPDKDIFILKSFQSGHFVVVIETYASREYKLAQRKVEQLKANPKLRTLRISRYKARNGKWRVYIGSFSKSFAYTFKNWAIKQKIIRKDAYVIRQ